MSRDIQLGASALPLDCVVSVASCFAEVVLIEDALNALPGSLKAKKATDGEGGGGTAAAKTAEPAADDGDAMAEVLVRAILLRLVMAWLKEAKRVPRTVATFCVELLNARIVPWLPAQGSVAAIVASLRAAIAGTGRCYVTAADAATASCSAVAPSAALELSAVLAERSIEAPAADQSRAALPGTPQVLGAFLASATLALVAEGASSIVLTSESIASLAFEALQANPAALLREYKEEGHAATAHSASIMRMMLVNSHNLASGKKGAYAPRRDCLEGASYFHGQARDAISTARKVAVVQLNSTGDAGHDFPFVTTASQLVFCFGALTSTSAERAAIVAGPGATPRPPTPPSGSPSGSDGAWPATQRSFVAMQALRAALEVEARLSLATIAALAEAASVKFAANKARKAEAAAKRKTQELATAAKEEEELQAATAAGDEKKVALIEKKRRKRAAKAEKDAAKAAKKAKKAGKKAPAAGGDESSDAGTAITLGEGARALFDWLSSPATDLNAALSPLDSTRLGAKAVLNELVSKLASGGVRRDPKNPKGMRDYKPEQMAVRQSCFEAIRRVFKCHNAVEIATPVLELSETLRGKYGEDSKLIYDLQDQGGEQLSMRYDLTVPFARYMAQHTPGNLKRFHIDRVYRRDQPRMTKGRYREFFQCDFDVAGDLGLMVPDAEVITVACEVLDALEIGTVKVKLSHRQLLHAMVISCGVAEAQFKPVCSAIDKLDKEPWSEVRREMVDDKGIDPDVADRIGLLVVHKSEPGECIALLDKLESETLSEIPRALAALKELRLLFTYLEALGSLAKVGFIDIQIIPSIITGLSSHFLFLYICMFVCFKNRFPLIFLSPEDLTTTRALSTSSSSVVMVPTLAPSPQAGATTGSLGCSPPLAPRSRASEYRLELSASLRSRKLKPLRRKGDVV